MVGSELTLYALLLAQPLVGWAMVSASGSRLVVFGSLASATHCAVRCRPVFRTPPDSFAVGLRIGGRDCRACQRGTAAHADASRRHAVTDDVWASTAITTPASRPCLRPTRRPTLRICARSRPPRCTLQYVNAPAPPRTLADTGGLVVTDDGRRVLVFDRCTGALTVLAFVLGVLMLVAGGFGAVALVAAAPSRALGAALPGRRPRLRGGDLCRGAQVSPPPQPAAARMPPGGGHRPQARVVQLRRRSRGADWIRCASRASCRSVRAHRNSSR